MKRLFLLMLMGCFAGQAFCKAVTDTLPKITVCNTDDVYAAPDATLKQLPGKKRNAPDVLPAFLGDAGQLKECLTSQPLKDAVGKSFTVKVVFLVNCKGESGNYELITKEEEILARQVLAIAAKVPDEWQAALKDNQPVDCYQVLTLNIADGKLNSFSYTQQ